MFEQDNLVKKLKEIERQNEAFERDKEKVFKDLGLTPDQINEALNDSSQYSPADWKKLQDLRDDMERQLQMRLANVKDVEKTKKNLESLSLPPWALFCK
jgi:hypothetical protein